MEEHRMSLGPGSIILSNSCMTIDAVQQHSHQIESNGKHDIWKQKQECFDLKTNSITIDQTKRKRETIFLESYHPTFEKNDRPKSKKEITKSFLNGIMRPNRRRGYLNCRLCNELIWGPNGMWTFPFYRFELFHYSPKSTLYWLNSDSVINCRSISHSKVQRDPRGKENCSKAKSETSEHWRGHCSWLCVWKRSITNLKEGKHLVHVLQSLESSELVSEKIQRCVQDGN